VALALRSVKWRPLAGVLIGLVHFSMPTMILILAAAISHIDPVYERAAASLGARPTRVFWRVTLPNVKWALLSGVILCTARAMGEFGAVSVVSGRIRGETTTLPIHVEILYNEYATQAAFAVASLLAIVAVMTLVLQTIVERRNKQVLAKAERKSVESNA